MTHLFKRCETEALGRLLTTNCLSVCAFLLHITQTHTYTQIVPIINNMEQRPSEFFVLGKQAKRITSGNTFLFFQVEFLYVVLLLHQTSLTLRSIEFRKAFSFGCSVWFVLMLFSSEESAPRFFIFIFIYFFKAAVCQTHKIPSKTFC